MTHITIDEIFSSHSEPLALRWLFGNTGGKRKISLEGIQSEPGSIVDDMEATQSAQDLLIEISSNKSLVGHLNLIHPNKIQVLGYTEIQYLNQLQEISRKEALHQLMQHTPELIIITEGQEILGLLQSLCESSQTPLFSTPLPSNKIVTDLSYYLSNSLTEVTTLHGVYMELITIGVLLTGSSGVGKSELALELITRGHRLVADDAPEFRMISPDTINGTCPNALTNFLEVRGLGIINVRELFGAGAVKAHKFLRLIIRLEHFDSERMLNVDRLAGSYRHINVLGLEIPEITLPVAPGRNLAVLVECATRNHILRMNGYYSSEDFTQRQRNIMNAS